MLELLWRGFTHWSMFVLGGVCYLLVGRVAVWCCGRLPMWFCCATNTLLITALEFVTGCLVNLHLGWDVWDYATQPLNLMGQVCIGFSALVCAERSGQRLVFGNAKEPAKADGVC